MFDRLSAGRFYDFAAPTSWNTVAYGKRALRGNEALFVFKAKAIAPEQKEAVRRGQPRKFKGTRVRKLQGMTARRVMTRARAADREQQTEAAHKHAQQPGLPRELVNAAVAAAANLAKLVEADKENYVCCVCMDRPVQVRFFPCNHSALCRTCTVRLGHHSLNVRRCPLCRATVKHVVDLTSGKRVKDNEPFGTFKKAGEEVLASRRLLYRTRAAASTRQRAQEESGDRDAQPEGGIPRAQPERAAFSWAAAGWQEISD